jgi:hypothetical protein
MAAAHGRILSYICYLLFIAAAWLLGPVHCYKSKIEKSNKTTKVNYRSTVTIK